MNQFYTVRQVAEFLYKSEETIKRWIRAGKFPNAMKENDKSGWKIPEYDVQNLTPNTAPRTIHTSSPTSLTSCEATRQDEREFASLAYQAVTMTMPTETILDLLSPLGIKRVLEILLVMRQSPQKVKNHEGFIDKAIKGNWNPNSIPIKFTRKKSVEKHVRKEILPDWFDENENTEPKEEQKDSKSEEVKLKELDDLLKSIRS